jgi:hypothetical protein
MRTALGFTVGIAFALVAPSALAQDTGGTAGGGASTGGTVQAGGSAEVAAPLPPPAAAPAPAPAPPVAAPAPAKVDDKDDAVTDHEKVIGRFAVGYMGVTQLPIGGGTAAQNVRQDTVAAPILGIRYWLNPRVGLDLGLGIALQSSSAEVEQNNTTTTTDGPAIFGGAIHGGVPIALSTGKHYTFQVVPELNLGVTSRTDKFNGANPPPDLKHSGFRADLGARVGAEIHFGFIGVPELALQATVGLYFSRQVWKNSQDSGQGVPAPLSSSIGASSLSTNVQSDPWAIFTNNISALYYF